MTKIFIVGTNHHNTLSMVRSFGEEGQKVSLFIYGDRKSYIAKSVYVEKAYFFVTATEAINFITKICQIEETKPLVIACSDEVSAIMDLHYDEFIGRCHFFNAGGTGIITEFMDKQRQIELARYCGFHTPNSMDISPKDVDLSSIRYPCLLKPKRSIHGGKNINICFNPADLHKCLKIYSSQYNVLIQDYILKEHEIVVLGLSYYGNIIVPGYVHKNREERGGTTYGAVRPATELDMQIIEACKKLIREVGYNGLWGIECIKSGNDYFFIELNMRNDATTYALKISGVNLPYLYLRMIESPLIKPSVDHIQPINSIVEFSDFNFVLKGKVSLLRWIKEYRMATCKYFYSKEDILPFCSKMKEYILFLIRRAFKF